MHLATSLLHLNHGLGGRSGLTHRNDLRTSLYRREHFDGVARSGLDGRTSDRTRSGFGLGLAGAVLGGLDHQPFGFTHGPSDPDSYLRQRLVFEHVSREAAPDQLFVEEAVLSVLGTVAEGSCAARVSAIASGATAYHSQ